MDRADHAVVADSVCKRYGASVAADNVSLKVSRGQIYGLIGPDGAGKTTMLRVIAGILKPDSGEAFVCGHSCETELSAVKNSIAYMSQKFGLYPDMTVLENIKFYADLYGVGKKGMRSRIDELLDFSYMKPFKHRQAGKLSGGMKQKLQLICALVHKPEVLLLDEPTNGVDPVSRRDFWRILYGLSAEGMTILMSTAYLDEAERCGVVGLMQGGRIIAEGTPADVVKQSGLKVLSVRSGGDKGLVKRLKSALGGGRVHAYGDRIRVLSTDTEADGVRLKELAGTDSEHEKPMLEDIFMSIGEGSDADEHILSLIADGAGGNSGTALDVSGLTKRFGDFTAVNNISLTVPYGEIFGFLGPNGAGKSTTIKILCGLLPATEGQGMVGGIDIVHKPELIKSKIGYMSQKFSLYEDLKVYENIDFYGGVYGLTGRELAERRDWSLKLAGLEDRKDMMTSELVGGWRQRLALACAILHRPSIVFLDEPTSGADPASRRLFWAIINELAHSGVTVFVSTHYMEEAEYCDRLALIFRGDMIAMGTPAELKRSLDKDKMEDVFITLIERADK
ncbi:ATP-binding cassette domain-containing protein [Seleniivibrio woodruffii]|uniref:ABC-2 type transport system ATP-binding protein n=1 Tax=Seleniivibrio woodruffii TaxID=1078050 RepID=A0A4R1KGR5_9BACT|nr:ATP-binding cassette domain-containing protein [Seleniivibrio woodruffii]TCK62539.1 ABC-2 type transport system ATP-binding protein [Seleniivibrio woodruffii]TVZ37034.1 ABC-2 type transport system ATP-binding protein [Seleniivibrio woodruffii]